MLEKQIHLSFSYQTFFRQTPTIQYTVYSTKVSYSQTDMSSYYYVLVQAVVTHFATYMNLNLDLA